MVGLGILNKLDISEFKSGNVWHHDPLVLLRSQPLLLFFKTPCGLDDLLDFVSRPDLVVTVPSAVFPGLASFPSATRDLRVIRRTGAAAEVSSLWDNRRFVALDEVEASFRKWTKCFGNDCVFKVSRCRD